jgi:uncharacterized protein YjeT (DUF2065 family)
MGDGMWHDLLVGFALMLVIEGILPFLNPAKMRQIMLMVCNMDDRVLRFLGLTSMVLGVVLLVIVN